MKAPSISWLPWIAAGVAVGAAWYFVRRQGGAAQAGAAAGQAVASAAGGVITGAVTGVAGAVGIPATSEDQCSRDLAAGKTWDASFSCPAGRFTRAVLGLDVEPAKGEASQPGTGAGTATQWDMQGSASFDELAQRGAVWWPMP